MYRQIDDIAMGSSLGPVLAIFLSVTVRLAMPENCWPKFYRRYVDDTFSLFCAGKPEALDFLELLNSLHPSLSFTMEAEENGKLPFLDALVMRDVDKFSTRWDSYSDTSKKFALIRTLALRAKRICSPEHLAAELVKVRAILQRNGYPRPIVDQVVGSVVNKLPVETVKRKPIYLRLPWIESASVAFRKRIQCLTRKAVPFCDAITSFTSRSLIYPCRKDVLPTEDLSNVIYSLGQ